jgi:hypothetical protein
VYKFCSNYQERDVFLEVETETEISDDERGDQKSKYQPMLGITVGCYRIDDISFTKSYIHHQIYNVQTLFKREKMVIFFSFVILICKNTGNRWYGGIDPRIFETKANTKMNIGRRNQTVY